MAGRIIHFGEDLYHRVLVLKNEGFAVDVCCSPRELLTALKTGTDAAAVVIGECRTADPIEVCSVARSVSVAPVILFPGTDTKSAGLEHEFDLIVSPLTPPEEWVGDIRDLIERRVAVHTRSRALRASGQELRAEPAVLRSKAKTG